MAKRAAHKTELIPHQRVHERLMQDPDYARAWQETELADQARIVAAGWEPQACTTALAVRPPAGPALRV